MCRIFHGLLALLLLAGAARGGTFSLGIDELEKSGFTELQGKRVGLVTNPSGADSQGRSAIDVLYHAGPAHNFRLVRLFGPEHGVDGLTPAGKNIGVKHDPHTGLIEQPLFQTAHGDFRHPSAEQFAGLDCIVYDVQDLGNRSYTFISTLGNVMDEAAQLGIEVIVLDRPNPLGGVRIEGPRLDSSLKSFVGQYDMPIVYGLTPGELAKWINARYLSRPCNLKVITMKGWTRGMVWEDTHLSWVPTSPNVQTIGAARGYTATGMLGEIGIESGLGGPHPFQMVSGNGWDNSRLAEQFNELRIPGVRATATRYHADDGKDYEGIWLKIDPWNAGNLAAISYQAIQLLQHNVRGFEPFGRAPGQSHGQWADQLQMFDKCTGTSRVRQQLADGVPVSRIIHSWDSGVSRWAVEREPFLLYAHHLPAAVPSISTATGAPAGVTNSSVRHRQPAPTATASTRAIAATPSDASVSAATGAPVAASDAPATHRQPAPAATASTPAIAATPSTVAISPTPNAPAGAKHKKHSPATASTPGASADTTHTAAKHRHHRHHAASTPAVAATPTPAESTETGEKPAH